MIDSLLIVLYSVCGWFILAWMPWFIRSWINRMKFNIEKKNIKPEDKWMYEI